MNPCVVCRKRPPNYGTMCQSCREAVSRLSTSNARRLAALRRRWGPLRGAREPDREGYLARKREEEATRTRRERAWREWLGHAPDDGFFPRPRSAP